MVNETQEPKVTYLEKNPNIRYSELFGIQNYLVIEFGRVWTNLDEFCRVWTLGQI